MTWEVQQKELGPGKDDDGRDFVTDGEDLFHVDRAGAQRLADLLNKAAEKKEKDKK